MTTMHLLTEVAQVNSGDTAWIIVCTALVLLMTPGLAFFYAGMVRSKHALAMIMQSFVTIAIVSVTWVLVGYSLAFDHDLGGGLIGGLHMFGLTHAEVAVPGLHLSVPPLAFVTFQMMFAILTAALLSGASADRMRFGAFVTFIAIWSVVVYAPLANWTWSPEGWLNKAGLLDFAGGTVVEICSGASALALALVIGPRRGWPREIMAPHNLPLTMLGAGLLWFGWIGFNAGSALSAGHLAANAALATHLSGVGGMIGWLLLEKRITGKATTLGAASGAVAGLVAITPAAGAPSWRGRASACSRPRHSPSRPAMRSRGLCEPRWACGSPRSKRPRVWTPASTPRPPTNSPHRPAWEGSPDEAHHRDRQAVQGRRRPRCPVGPRRAGPDRLGRCLLYTSDAA